MSKRSLKLLAAGLVCLFLTACQTTTPKLKLIPDKPVEPERVLTPEQRKKAEEQARKDRDLNEKAVITAKVGDADKSIELFEQLIKQNPKYPYAFTNLALQLLKKDNIIGARALFGKAIEQDNRDAIAYNHLALLQRREGLFDQAHENYLKAIEADERYANAHLNLGILLDIYLQDLPTALKHYETYQSLIIDKDDEATKQTNEMVEKWIVDIKRRVDSSGS
mgnify:FL=1